MRMKKWQERAARTSQIATGEVPCIMHTIDSPSPLLGHTAFPALYMPMSFCLVETRPHGEKAAHPGLSPAHTQQAPRGHIQT